MSETTPLSQASEQSFNDELHPDFERRKWAFDRVVWVLMLAFIVAALLGVFGSGVLSRETIERPYGDGGAIELEHPRFARFHSQEDMSVLVNAPEATGGTLRVTLSSSFTSQTSILSIDPEPDSQSFGREGAVLEWEVSDWSQPFEVALEYEPNDWGRISGSVVVAAGDGAAQEIDFTQIVFP